MMRLRCAFAVAAMSLAVLAAGCGAGSSGNRPASQGGGTSAAGSSRSQGGGTSATDSPGGPVISMTFAPRASVKAAALAATAATIRRRAAELHLVGAGVAVRGSRVVITGPAADRGQLQAITAPGVLRMRPVLLEATATASPQEAKGTLSAASPSVQALFGKLDCHDPAWQRKIGYGPYQAGPADSQTVSCSRDGSVKYALDAAALQGTDVVAAKAFREPSSGHWQVDLTFSPLGTKAFAALTTSLYERYGPGGTAASPGDEVAIVVDGTVVSAPTVQGPVTGGHAVIAGSFTRTAATRFAAEFRSGALPVVLRLVSTGAS